MSDKWQPIETAPKDGTAILGYFGQTAGDEPPDMAVIRYDKKYEWVIADLDTEQVDEPTHWMPLPDPPKGT